MNVDKSPSAYCQRYIVYCHVMLDRCCHIGLWIVLYHNGGDNTIYCEENISFHGLFQITRRCFTRVELTFIVSLLLTCTNLLAHCHMAGEIRHLNAHMTSSCDVKCDITTICLLTRRRLFPINFQLALKVCNPEYKYVLLDQSLIESIIDHLSRLDY